MNTQTVIRELNSDTKIKIICFLLRDSDGRTVTSLVSCMDGKTRTNISKQISELRRAGLVAMQSIGRNNIYTINPQLNPAITQLLKHIVNTFHLIDEERRDFCPYL